jgi:hypothetical protein
MSEASGSGRIWRSIGAVLAGLLTVVVLSLGTDQILHELKVYPPWGEPMHDPRLNALALSYRLVYGVLGPYITARLAPFAPMGHALFLGALGLVLASLGAYAAIAMNVGPAWYPIALAASSLPTAWLGGRLHQARQPRAQT